MESKQLLAFSILSLLLLITFVAAAITPSSETAAVYQSKAYTFTISNTDATVDANISAVNITLPSQLTYISASNATTSTGVFAVAGQNLSWIGDNTIANLTSKTFSFNANATVIGTYKILIQLTNASGTTDTNVSVVVSDGTVPTISVSAPSTPTTIGDSNKAVTFTAASTDNYALSAAKLVISDSSSDVLTNITSITGRSNSTSIIYSFPSVDKSYTWVYTINDSSNNLVTSTGTITFQGTTSGGSSPGITTVSQTTPAPTTTTEAPVTTVSFIQRIINWFKNLFHIR